MVQNITLSPLDQIRLCEAEVTRRIASARQAAEKGVSKARSEAATLKMQAMERGRKRGQAQYEEVISRSEEEARVMVAQAQRRSDELLRRSVRRIEQAVRQVVNIVTGLDGGRSET